MKIFNYSGARAKSLDELTTAQKVHIIHYFQHDLISDGGEISLKHVKKFSCNRKVLEQLLTMSFEDVMITNSETFNPLWKSDEFIFHPEPDVREDSFGGMDYDSVHVGGHIKWTEENCFKFLAGTLETALETMRDSTIGCAFDSFTDAYLYVKSDLNKVYCRFVGFDHEELCKLALVYKDQHDKHLTFARANLVATDVADDFENEFDLNGEDVDYSLVIEEQTVDSI
jgi:hypothetical protein